MTGKSNQLQAILLFVALITANIGTFERLVASLAVAIFFVMSFASSLAVRGSGFGSHLLERIIGGRFCFGDDGLVDD